MGPMKCNRNSSTALSTMKIVCLLVLCVWKFAGATLGQCDNNNTNKLFNCSGAELTEIPGEGHIMTYTETLDLSNNFINNITDVDFPTLNINLRTLLLANNHISTVKRDAFSLLTNLVNLDLSGNLIHGSMLDGSMFDDLRRLSYLNIERNPLRIIVKDTFTFIELPALSHLDLSHCEISTIEDSAIDLPTLRYLDLAWNQLKSFNRDGFRMLIALHTLDLSHNRFTVIEDLPYMPEIRTINLDSNAISEVKLRDTIWDYADSLEHLFMRNNDLLTFTPDSFPFDLDPLKGIHLDNNPIHCDCKMKWVAMTVEHKEKNHSMTCRYPTSLKGRNLLTVPAEALTCSYSVANILMFVGLILGLLVCLVVTMYFIFFRRRRRPARRPKFRKPDKSDMGGNYTAVYTRDDDEAKVMFSEDRELLKNDFSEEKDLSKNEFLV